MGVALGSLLLVLVSGVVAGFMGHWWSRGWMWVSVGMLVAVSVAMGVLGTPYYERIRRAVGLPTSWTQGKEPPPSEEASPAELDALLTSRRPELLTAIGVGGAPGNPLAYAVQAVLGPLPL